jgi:glycosyltransferase involved in cell wall biosynthesis
LQCEKHKCKYSISEWRNAWLKFLEKCDEIRCFSESSKEILRFAYKTLNVEKITIVPHDMSFSKFTPINVKNKKVPVYGVVGVCKIEIKGNKVMQTILKQVPENIRFVFVGTKKSQLKNNRKNVIFLGKYRHDELQEILEKENVTHIIFPSVVPETFSYVVSEIMQMNLPIMCFNIGAQAEKVSKYEKGIVCESVDEMVKKVKNG